MQYLKLVFLEQFFKKWKFDIEFFMIKSLIHILLTKI